MGKPIIRQAIREDIHQCVESILKFQKDFGWSDITSRSLDRLQVFNWIEEKLYDDKTCLFVADSGFKIVGGCGGFIGIQHLPPRLRFVSEWAWWGTDKKILAQTWNRVESWGMEKGALFSDRITTIASNNKVIEIHTWKGLENGIRRRKLLI